jgi:uncharacterized phage protein (TIGR01671 family)
MREIKFRGREIKTGKWVYGVPVFSVNARCYMIHGATEDAVNTQNEVDFIYSEVDPKTVSQYTGLRDKNGKEIWKGDITDRGIIEFQTNLNWDSGGSLHSGFYFKTYRDEGDLEYHLGMDNCEVIGNIYEHGELLNEK